MKIEFNQKVDKTSAELLTNYYVGIGEDNVTNSSIEHNNSGFYKAELQADGKTVIISAVDPETHVIWTDKNTDNVFSTPDALLVNGTDTVVKNKTVTVQVRNVKTSGGELMSTQEKSFTSVDTEAAEIFGTTLDKDGVTVIPTEDNITKVLVTSDDDVLFMFDEPVYDDTNVEYYLDGRNITAHVSVDPSVTLDVSGRTLEIDGAAAGIEDLTLGNHNFEIVGLEDLAGNKTVGDIYNAVIQVVEPGDDGINAEAPEVKSVIQKTEGTFEVTFKAAPVDNTLIVVKDSQGNTVGTATTTTGADTTETVTFATDVATSYKTSTKLSYTIEVTGADGGKIVSDADANVKANKYSKVHTFNLDLTAPTVVYSTTDSDGKVLPTEFVKSTALGKIAIPFKDDLFGGDVALGTVVSSVNDVILKQHIGEETKSLSLPFADIAAGDLVANVLTIDVEDLAANGSTQAIKDAATAMLNTDGDALPAGNYELILPRGLVDDLGPGEASTKKITGSTKIPFAGDTVRFEVKEAGQGSGASVPQTAQNLVSYNASHDAIIVEFVGEDINAATAKNPANYTLAGKKLASDTYIEYETLKDGSGNVTGGEARIFLNKDTVKLNGNYTLRVEGVSTNSGAKMIPVNVTVSGMQDNTRPVLESAVITGDAKLELKFSESIVISSQALAAGNFEVLVNGSPYTVKEADVASNDTLVIAELRDIVDFAGKTVTIRTKADSNTDFFVRDTAGNELKTGVTVTATHQ